MRNVLRWAQRALLATLLGIGLVSGLAGGLVACGGGGSSGTEGPGSSPSAARPPGTYTARIHYQRTDGIYDGWGVYSWEGPKLLYTVWPSTDKYRFDEADGFGAFIDIAMDTAKSQMQFLVNKSSGGGNAIKEPDCDLKFSFSGAMASTGQEVWVKASSCTVFDSLADATGIDLSNARAMWLVRGTIAWPGKAIGSGYKLYHALNGGIRIDANGRVSGADGAVDLRASSGIGPLAARYPHLADALSLTLPATSAAQVPGLLKGQLVVVQSDSSGKAVDATQLQIQGVIDDVYAAAAARATLGATIGADGRPVFRLWAPTARAVTLEAGSSTRRAMALDAASGVWSATGDASWVNRVAYQYAVQVWSRTDGATLRDYKVSDPYAVTLEADVYGSTAPRAVVADLASAATKPAGWDAQAIPPAIEPEDIVLYELHIRDFSAADASVPAADRGKYNAFARSDSLGMRHLAELSRAGLTHVHLLPAFDIASVNEGGCSTPAITNTDPVSTRPQSIVTRDKDKDCFNWGYDPKHFGAPDGSYASTAADPLARVREFRGMVASLQSAGLQTVMDVVYNHTAGNFLDLIVPGYYYRLDADGNIETSTCCQNTATEFAMMAKLMSDTLVRWAVDYRVDGFRFDIMGHIPKAVMVDTKARVQAAVGPSRKPYFYGEAWNFGEVQDDARFVQARQLNLAGTGIGSFNDRLRDAVRGGGPFDSGDQIVVDQGFASGLCYDANELAGSCSSSTRSSLYQRQDWIRSGMAGGLSDFRLHGVLAGSIDYFGQSLGYTRDPQEIINYAGVHDGETLYDISQYKHPTTISSAARARSQVVALGTVLMAQGVPFIHAGDELLRSKAFDRDSYNSGDWFNRVDWSATTNHMNDFGLPPAEKNQDNWDLMRPRLQSALVAPSAADIANTRDAVLDLLRVRKSSTMFRLRTGTDVKRCVSFPDESAQRDGLIVMRIGQDGAAACGDGAWRTVIVLVNANDARQTLPVAGLSGRRFELHPLLAAGHDAAVRGASFTSAGGSFSVPGRTVAVFVER
jgi:pullulanase